MYSNYLMDLLSFLYNFFRTVFIVFDVLLFGTLILSLIKGWGFRPKLMQANAPQERIFTLDSVALKERWEEILKKAESSSLESLRIAIVDADNFADDILRRMGIEGKHVADRMEQLPKDDFASLERLWRAHRVRNQLVHEPDFKISAEEGTKTLKDYEAFLKEAGAI